MPTLRPTLMVIDLDRFKQVNDSVGIAVGDSILLTLARRLTRILKPQDTLARLAGDQFGLILMSEQDPARITAFAETIRKTIRAPIAFNDREIFLTASIGLALSDPQTQLTEEIIKDAELAMYHSKRIGGDRIDVYKPAMRARKTDRLTLESELRRAIERQEITILYQPIVRLEDRSIAGFEALARWDHPKLGRMSPSEFISIAEEIGLIVDLGMFVMDQTARQLSVWQRAMRSREPIFASVNVSSRQLLRHDLIHDIRTVLSRSSVARGTLKLELTESLVMENPEHAAQMLTRIRELGTGLSLDDFGTGHSSLAYLQRFPFDTIKIDQSFVRTTSRGTPPGDPEIDHRARPRPRHGRGGGRRGDGFGCGRALSVGLRIRAGLCLRRADGRRRRDAAADGRTAGSGELISLVVPRSRDPYPRHCRTRWSYLPLQQCGRGVWVPAFAGTTVHLTGIFLNFTLLPSACRVAM